MTAPSSLVPSPRAVTRVVRETADVFSLFFAREGLSFSPGQFNMLSLPGTGDVAISISGNPLDEHTLVHTIRAVGTVTKALSRLGPGDSVLLRGPFGAPWPLAECEGHDVIVMAGGLGLAPLRPAIELLCAQRQRFGRVAVLYGARSPDDLLFEADLTRYRSSLDGALHVSVDHAPRTFRGHVGVVTSLLPLVSFDPARAVALICGPEIMMRYAARDLERQGVSPDRIFVSLERNMHCGVGLCGHCQVGPFFVCKDGPVARLSRVSKLMMVREL